jgi:hypothetical protein
VFILDDEDLPLDHGLTVSVARFTAVSPLLILSYVTGLCDILRRMVGSTRVLAGLVAFAVLGVSAAAAQFTPYRSSSRNILEGSWESCREADGRYAERVYDHVVNGVGQFEVHLGPAREFAIFPSVQSEHRAHSSAGNLLKDYNVPMRNNRAKQRWELPTLGLAFTVTMGGGSRTDCENWYILLEPLQKKS